MAVGVGCPGAMQPCVLTMSLSPVFAEPAAIITACTAYLDYAMRLMATESVLVSLCVTRCATLQRRG